MTVAFGFTYKGQPILVSDILASSSLHPEKPPILPTGVPAWSVFKANEQLKPVRLCQKMTIIGDNVVIAWSGDADVAREATMALVKTCKEQPFTRESLAIELNTLKLSGATYLAFIVEMSKENENEAAVTMLRPSFVPVFQSVYLENVAIIGHGDTFVGDRMTDFMQPQLYGDDATDSVNIALQYIGMLLFEEIISGGTLEHYFGAGYELVYFAGGKFQKLDDITFLLWELFADDGCDPQISELPYLAVRMCYHNDVLIMRSYRCLKPTDDSSGDFNPEDHAFLIPPLHRTVSKEESDGFWPPPTMNGSILCNFVLLTRNGKHEAVWMFDQNKLTPQKERSIEFFENGDILTTNALKQWAREHVLPLL